MLYAFSHGIYLLIYYVIPLRRRVTIENLTKSFPDLNQKDIKKIYKQHLYYMCSMFLETFKGFSLSQAALIPRWKVTNPEIFEQFKNQSVIIISGHYANWEWGFCIPNQINYICANIFKPIRNQLINKYLLKDRKSVNVDMVAVKDSARYFLSHRQQERAYVLIADQHPGGTGQVLWMDFLNQDTAFITGPEKYAKSFNYPVVYCAIDYVRQGYYEVTATVVSSNPQTSPEGEITEKSMRILEAQIRAKPAYWMWGHKRWKLKKNA